MELKNRSFQYGKVALAVLTQYHQLQFVLQMVIICTDMHVSCADCTFSAAAHIDKQAYYSFINPGTPEG